MNLNDLRKNAYTSGGAEDKKSPAPKEETPAGQGFKKFGAAAAAEILKNQGLVKVPVEEPAEEGDVVSVDIDKVIAEQNEEN